MRVVGTATNGSTVRLASASLQSLVITTSSSETAVNVCRNRSARMCEVASCTLSMSFMIDDISRPVECDSKNSAPCFSTLSNTSSRRLVTAEKPT